MTGRIRIGVSGWRYIPWRGNFYPRKLAQARELEYASRIFSSIELNGSELYNSRYTSEELDRWAECIAAWADGGQPADARLISQEPPPARASRDVYCYFDNTDKLHAPDNARELMQKLGLPVPWHPG